MGHREPDERVRRQKSFNDPDRGLFVAPRSELVACVSPPANVDGRVPARASSASAPTARASVRRTSRTVLDLVRAGLPPRSTPARAALERPGRAAGRRRPAARRRWSRRPSATSSPSRSTSKASCAASAAAPGWSRSGTRRRRSTSPTRTRSSARTTTSPSPGLAARCDFELEVAAVVGRDGRVADAGRRPRPHLRLHDHERLVGPRPAAPRDEGRPRPGQGQGLRHHPRAVAGHRRRARAVPRRRRVPRPGHARCRSTASRSARTCCQHGLAVRGAGRLRLPRHARSAPATCSAPAPAATAAAWPSCGAGAAQLDPPPLQPGDVVEMTVEGIGTIRNRVVAGRPHLPPLHRPDPDPRPQLRRRQCTRHRRKETTVFEYFPGNYVWNLGVVATLNSGGLIDEVDRACRPIREAAAQGSDAGTARLPAGLDGADRSARGAGGGGGEGRAHPHRRAAVLPRHQLPLPGRADAGASPTPTGYPPTSGSWNWRRSRSSSRDPRISRVEIPYEGTTLPGVLQRGARHRRRPGAGDDHVVNGLDSTKEHMYTSEHWAELAARGISSLMVDSPAPARRCGCRA